MQRRVGNTGDGSPAADGRLPHIAPRFWLLFTLGIENRNEQLLRLTRASLLSVMDHEEHLVPELGAAANTPSGVRLLTPRQLDALALEWEDG